jgi:hypothetical protein
MRTLISSLLLLVLMISVTHSDAFADIGKAYRQAEKLSNAVKLKTSSDRVAEMQKTLKFALKRLRESHDKKDIIQTNCVKDKLASIKGLLRISEEADVSLREAVVTGQPDLINHEYVKILMAVERIRLSRVQVDGCVGDVNDPLTLKQQQRSTPPEIFDESVQQFTPTSDEQSVLIYEPIASERPEAISASE